MNHCFFVRSEKLNSFFCGKCGREPERREIRENAGRYKLFCEYCNKRRTVVTEGKTLGYCFEKVERGLVLSVAVPGLVRREIRGKGCREITEEWFSKLTEEEKSLVFSGMKWEKVFRVLFMPATREPMILKEWSLPDVKGFFEEQGNGRSEKEADTGDAGKEPAVCAVGSTPEETPERTRRISLEKLAAAIDRKELIRLNEEEDVSVIRKVFPGILDIYNVEMFVRIFLHKGYRFEDIPDRRAVRRLLKEDPGIDDWMVTPEEYEREQRSGAKEEALTEADREAFSFYADLKEVWNRGSVPFREEPVEKTIPVLATLHRIPCETDRGQERYYLRVVLKNGRPEAGTKEEESPDRAETGYTVFLFSGKYAACSRDIRLEELFQGGYRLTGGSLQAIRIFDTIYPENHLMQYMERSSNVLVPLLSADYHEGIELAAKAGAAGIAERYSQACEQHSHWKPDPMESRNLNKKFGLPVSVLRKIPPGMVDSWHLSRFSGMIADHPQTAQLRRLPQHVFTDRLRTNLRAYATIFLKIRGEEPDRKEEEKTAFRILRYLEQHPADGQYYFDYLRICGVLEMFPYGLTPSGSIRKAHDNVLIELMRRKYIRNTMLFRKTVSSPDYLRLTTCWAEGDQEFFREDPFVIVAPAEEMDLINESTRMHNCVQSYIQSVENGNTEIYFLRRKSRPEKSLGTIEVRDGCLVQAKGFGNSSLNREAQLFIRKWCKRKEIRIRTYDIYFTA